MIDHHEAQIAAQVHETIRVICQDTSNLREVVPCSGN